MLTGQRRLKEAYLKKAPQRCARPWPSIAKSHLPAPNAYKKSSLQHSENQKCHVHDVVAAFAKHLQGR